MVWIASTTLRSWQASFLLAKTRSVRWVLFFFSIDFIQTILTQAVTVIGFQIGFGSVGEFHLHAPAVHGMDALEFFSATGTSLFHKHTIKGL